jgi:hypothetical protein
LAKQPNVSETDFDSCLKRCFTGQEKEGLCLWGTFAPRAAATSGHCSTPTDLN